MRPSKLPSNGRKCDADADEDCEKAKDFIVIPIFHPYIIPPYKLPLYYPPYQDVMPELWAGQFPLAQVLPSRPWPQQGRGWSLLVLLLLMDEILHHPGALNYWNS